MVSFFRLSLARQFLLLSLLILISGMLIIGLWVSRQIELGAIGVTCAKADMMAWPPGAHASTFGGNPVACAAANATIKLLEEQLVANAATVGAHLMNGLRELHNKHAIIGEVRGKGLMIGIELVKDRATKERAVEARNALVQAMFRRGVLVLGAGKNALRLAPPLVLSKDQADAVLGVLDEALGEIAPR